MRPTNRYFHRGQPMMPRQIQQLRVKPEALNRLLLEKDAAAFPPKRFESALSIHKRQPQNEAHNPVEYDAGKLPEQTFMHFDEAAVHRAGTDGHIICL